MSSYLGQMRMVGSNIPSAAEEAPSEVAAAKPPSSDAETHAKTVYVASQLRRRDSRSANKGLVTTTT